MRKIFFIATASTLMLASCASYEKSAPIMGMSGAKINTYVAADLDYENAEKISGTVELKTLFGFIPLVKNGKKFISASNRYRGLSTNEKRALYKAKEASGKDIILEPEFSKEGHSWFFGAYKTEKITVKGWGVDIKRIKEDTHGVAN